jgi:putative ABC transport system ATP-binding protein
LFGPSGSGKTTLLGLLAGVLAGYTGSVEVLGQDMAKLRGSARDAFRGTHIGYIFQQFNLIPYLTVRENITLPGRLQPARGKQAGDVTAVAQRLGIASLLERGVTELSVGQQQRVAAARALLGGPELLIADEPTSALDFDHRERFLELLFENCALTNSTLLFVSHDRSLAGKFDRQLSLVDFNRAQRQEPAA